MPRVLLDSQGLTTILSSAGQKTVAAPTSVQLRRRRTAAYLDALKQLDAGGHVVDQSRIDALKAEIAAQFPDGPGTWPLGWVACCYLGPPYQVHMLDLAGSIVQHFRNGERLPGLLENARGLAMHGDYLFIEVYADRLVAVSGDGSTSVCEHQGS